MSEAERDFEGHELKSYGSLKKKVPLGDLLPLESPMAVMIDPSNGCTFRCVFCPTGDHELLEKVGRPKGQMELGLFKKIIDDMKGFPQKPRVLYLLKDGEPLLNKHIIEMIAYAKAANVVDSVEMTSNASLLTAQKADGLIDAGLDLLRISVEATDGDGYKKVTQVFDRFDKILSNVRYLSEQKKKRGSKLHLHCKIVDTGLSAEQKRKFLADFGPLADSVNIDVITGWSSTFDTGSPVDVSTKTGAYGVDQVKADRVVCPEPFMKIAVNFDGQVSPCCVDWSMSGIVGDCRTQNIVDIWNGPYLKNFRLAHLKGKRKELKACTDCTYFQGIPSISDIDSIRDRLIPEYEK